MTECNLRQRYFLPGVRSVVPMVLDQPPQGATPYQSPRWPSASIFLERAECRVVPGETARFPFAVRTEQDAQSIHDLDIVSANPNFNRGGPT